MTHLPKDPPQSLRDAVDWDARNWSRAANFWLAHLSRPIRGSRILEIGGRDAGLSVWFAGQGAASVLCTDLEGPSPQGLGRIADSGVSDVISTAALDATALDYVAEFDFVVFKSVLGGIGGASGRPGQQTALQGMHRALKPGGQLLFAENLTASPLHSYLRRRFVGWGDRWLYVTAADVAEMLAVFDQLDSQSLGFAGAFGRTDRQRDKLAALDRRLLERMVPRDWRYILTGVASKW